MRQHVHRLRAETLQKVKLLPVVFSSGHRNLIHVILSCESIHAKRSIILIHLRGQHWGRPSAQYLAIHVGEGLSCLLGSRRHTLARCG